MPSSRGGRRLSSGRRCRGSWRTDRLLRRKPLCRRDQRAGLSRSGAFFAWGCEVRPLKSREPERAVLEEEATILGFPSWAAQPTNSPRASPSNPGRASESSVSQRRRRIWPEMVGEADPSHQWRKQLALWRTLEPGLADLPVLSDAKFKGGQRGFRVLLSPVLHTTCNRWLIALYCGQT